MVKKCLKCGKEFEVEKCRYDRTKFCSMECRRSYSKKHILHCEYCGKSVEVQDWKYNNVISGVQKHFYCSKECRLNNEKHDMIELYKEFAERGFMLLDNEYIAAKHKMAYICVKHADKGVQYINYHNFKYGNGCRYCGFEKTFSKRRSTFEYAKSVFDKNDMILIDQEYINDCTPMKYICKHHKEVGIQYKTLINAFKQHCPYCNISKGEAKIVDVLSSNNVKYIREKTFDGLLGINGGNLRFDFYLPELNYLIEYQGNYHDNTVSIQTKDEYETLLNHDNRKKEYVKKNNIPLLEIWYYDFDKIEEILKEKKII